MNTYSQPENSRGRSSRYSASASEATSPIGTILSAALMLRYSFDMAEEADAIEKAVSSYLDAGYRTADIMSDGMTQVGCEKCGDLVIENLRKV